MQSMQDTKNWNDFLKVLENKLSGFAKPWIGALEPASSLFEKSENDIFLIKSSQPFAIQFLNTKHRVDIEHALEEFTGLKRVVRFVQVEEIKKKKAVKPKENEHSQTAIKMENLAQMHSFCGLDLKYTFNNFVEGENSRYAYRIAQMVAENPGQKKFNPLFLSGSVGLGKTHLMQAIGHKVLKNFPHLKIRYTKAEEFGNKLIEALSKGIDVNEKMKKFRDMHRNVDILLVDDIQWIEGKKRTQDEIFNTFDALYQAGKQVVFASDRPLSAFETIPDRIKSRFKWGIEANITVPDFETRIKIIKHHALLSEFPISDEVAMLLAKEFSTNVRELEGAYNKASAIASIEGVELDCENVKKFLNLDERKKKISVKDVIETCAKYFSIEPDDILSTARAKGIANARKFAIYLSRELLNLSYPVLAQEFKRNHTTIMYLHETVKKDITANKAVDITAKELQELLKV